ncbi:MAG: SDR family NAD(P)-dependent oxidoreductase [Dehalococcoidales bacterium]|nr:SDR family NAD(P)-dependent oxidoreductase [Dehalococcoidales bacterium]
MVDRLKGKVAVVTGSGQGVGRAIALAMAGEGARVVTNNRRPGSTGLSIYGEDFEKKLSEEEKEQARQLGGDAGTVAKEIRDMGGEAVPFFGDVGDFQTAGKLVQTAVDSFGRIDILVNNAGTFRRGFIWELSEEAWDYVVTAKLKGSFNCIRHTAPLMKEQGWGRIINCTSGAWLGNMEHPNYSAANAGVVGLTRSVAREMYKYGVTCNAYAPLAMTRGVISLAARTRIMSEAGITIRAERGTETTAPAALETIAGPEGLAPFVAYLATEEAGSVSGTVFRVVGNEIAIYADPEEKYLIKKDAGLWTVDELAEAVPAGLLKGYRSIAAD